MHKFLKLFKTLQEITNPCSVDCLIFLLLEQKKQEQGLYWNFYEFTLQSLPLQQNFISLTDIFTEVQLGTGVPQYFYIQYICHTLSYNRKKDNFHCQTTSKLSSIIFKQYQKVVVPKELF